MLPLGHEPPPPPIGRSQAQDKSGLSKPVHAGDRGNAGRCVGSSKKLVPQGAEPYGVETSLFVLGDLRAFRWAYLEQPFSINPATIISGGKC